MKNQELQSSLIKSGVILTLCIFLIYAFAVDGSGGIVGTISSLFTGIIFLIGLVFAILFSVLVLVGIYFGILAMYGGDTCNKTYGELKHSLLTSTNCITKSIGSSCCTPQEPSANLHDSDIELLRADQKTIKSQITNINNSVDSLEKSISTLSSSLANTVDDIATLNENTASANEKLEEKVSTAEVDSSIAKLSGEISSIQSSLTPVTDKLTKLEEAISSLPTEKDKDETSSIEELVAQAVSGLQEELNTIKSLIDDLSPGDNSEASNDSTDEEKHRILTYFNSKKDEEKFIALVEEAVAKEMTYAQIDEFLDNSLSPEAAEVIAGHPSLKKDFIRDCRQQS